MDTLGIVHCREVDMTCHIENGVLYFLFFSYCTIFFLHIDGLLCHHMHWGMHSFFTFCKNLIWIQFHELGTTLYIATKDIYKRLRCSVDNMHFQSMIMLCCNNNNIECTVTGIRQSMIKSRLYGYNYVHWSSHISVVLMYGMQCSVISVVGLKVDICLHNVIRMQQILHCQDQTVKLLITIIILLLCW